MDHNVHSAEAEKRWVDKRGWQTFHKGRVNTSGSWATFGHCHDYSTLGSAAAAAAKQPQITGKQMVPLCSNITLCTNAGSPSLPTSAIEHSRNRWLFLVTVRLRN